jgi:hypothetical protein
VARSAWFVACGSLVAFSLAGALGACGSDDVSPVDTGDAGADGATGTSGGTSGGTSSGSSGDTTDSGGEEEQEGGTGTPPTSNPDQITCGSVECPADAQACCATPAPQDGGVSYTCQAEADTCAGAKVACDEKADCSGDDVCCISVSGGPLSSDCKASCSAQDVQLCKTDAECGASGSCKEYTCAGGRKVHACTKPAACN